MEIYINLEVDPFDRTYLTDNHRWVAYLESVGKAMDCPPDTEVSLTLTDNMTMQQLNHQYRDMDRPTDVLSFPQDMENNLLGDIIISVEKADKQAEEKKHSLQYELVLLATHGFLHLLGYDHAEEEDEKQMFGLQQELLDSFYTDCFGQDPIPQEVKP